MPDPITNFTDNNGVDLGKKLITKDYLISVYPSIADKIGIPPELWVWGSGGSGRLGNFATTTRSTPVTTFAGGTNWKQISAGSRHAAGIKTDGTLWIWGNNTYGPLGNNDTTNRSTPVTTFTGGTNWKQVSCGGYYTAAIKTDGTLWTWGNNLSGQLGKGFDYAVYSFALTPVIVFGAGTNWADTATGLPEELYTLSAGNIFSSAIKTDGTLWTWGNNGLGQLGINSTIIKYTPVTTFTGGVNWKQVSSGDTHTVAVKTDGTLWTWGNGRFGQLGSNNINQRSTPITTFAGGTNWADTATGAAEELYTISAAATVNAAIKTDGTLWTWGGGGSAQLGNNSTTNRSTPVTTFTGGTDWKQVSAGSNHTAAVKTDGTLWIWGEGNVGQLGNNSTTNRTTPVTTFTGGTDWKQVSASISTRATAAIKTDGTLWTWGSNSYSILGRLSALQYRLTPVTTFAGGTNWADTATGAAAELYTISAGDLHTAAIKTDGTLWVWGSGSLGRLGNFSTTNRSTPVTTFAGGTDWKQVSSGGSHTSAIKTDGTLWTWGNGGFGRPGTNDTITRSTPVTTFAGGLNWKQVSSGGSHTAAVKTDGTLWVWGSGSSGKLGNAVTTNVSTPVTTFAGGLDWKQVSSGGSHTAAIKTDGTLWTWGLNSSTQLGNNNTTSNRSTPITTFAGGLDWKQVSAGNSHTAAIKTDGTLWVWGSGGAGKLGNAVTTNVSTPVTTFAGGADWKQVSSGGYHTAAIKTDGTLWTWGFNNQGQIGNAVTTNRSTPVTTFAGGTNWKQVIAGTDHTIALKDDGVNKELYAFGNNVSVQLGMYINNEIPGQVDGLNWKQVSLGNGHSAAVKTDGTLWAWGNNVHGQVGDNTATQTTTPVTTFAGGTDWKQVSAGGVHTVAVKTDGTLWTWGYRGSGRLGNNNTSANRLTPVTTFSGGTDWKQVNASTAHSAAVKTDGTLWTWGYGSSGQLGNSNTATILTPVTTFAGGTNWKQVSVGNIHTIALKDDGVNKELYVWGDDNNQQLGQLNAYITTIPEQPEGGNQLTWKQVSTGGYHTAAVKTDGTLWTWGLNSTTQLGINNTISKSTPVTTFAGGLDWKQVSSGGSHTAAVKTDGTLWTWGFGSSGRLGNAVTTNRSTPVTTFAGGLDWKQVDLGASFAVAVKTDGTLWTWGFNTQGQLGNAVTTNVSTPVTTFAGGADWKQVSGGSSHTAAIKTDGTLWTWGLGGSGQLGTNSLSSVSTPVTTFVGGSNWKQVSAGTEYTIALKDDGVNKELYVFGNNSLGTLGTGVVPGMNLTPSQIFGSSSGWRVVDTGDEHTAAIKTDGTLWIWGDGVYGQLGNSSIIPASTPITTFAGGTNWKQASANSAYTSAIKTDGTLWTWGFNQLGRLGNNIETNRFTPITTFAGGTNWADTANGLPEELYTTSAGDEYSAAIKTDGTLWSWGRGQDGVLGNNNTIETSTPITTFAGGTNWKQVSGGNRHTAAIKTDGTLWVWGSGSDGRTGTNDTTNRSTPVTTFTGGTNWKQVSCGEQFTAAIKTDGTLWTWGYGNNGRLGRLDALLYRITPVTTFAGGTNWADTATGAAEELYTISGGYSHSAAIKTDGTLWVWGRTGISGRLGTNDTITRSTPVTTFAGGTDWKQISTAFSSSTAIKTDGTLWTWGACFEGQLGNGLTTGNALTPVTTFAGGLDWKQVSTQGNNTAAIKIDGTLWTWGENNLGGLGNNSTTRRSTPVTTFAGGLDWKQVSANSEYTAAIKTDGTLWNWGRGSYGRLGNAVTTNRSTPVTTFAGGLDWKQVSAGNRHTAAIKTDGTLWVWGNNYKGQLGSNDTIIRSTPVTTFAGGTNWKQVSSGDTYFILALKDDGVNKELYVFGNSDDQQLGTNINNSIPGQVEGNNWKQINSWLVHSAAVKTDGTLWTWGGGNYGRLGTNDTVERPTPVTTFAGGTDWKQVSVRSRHTAAIKTDGTLWTWGFNGVYGQLGINDTTDRSTPVTTFAGGTNWKQVAGGFYHTAAVKTDGTLWTWGRGTFGQLGINQRIDIFTPVTTFAGGTNWKQVSCGSDHTIALKDDGVNKQLYVWGYNSESGLGINYSHKFSTPSTTFAGGTNWRQIIGGFSQGAAIKTDGTLWTWGYGVNGRLGINDTSNRYTPVTTFAGGTNWKQGDFNGRHVVAIKTDGTLWTWGNNTYASLGINNTTDRFTPVTTFAGGTDWKQVTAGRSSSSALKSIDY